VRRRIVEQEIGTSEFIKNFLSRLAHLRSTFCSLLSNEIENGFRIQKCIICLYSKNTYINPKPSVDSFLTKTKLQLKQTFLRFRRRLKKRNFDPFDIFYLPFRTIGLDKAEVFAYNVVLRNDGRCGRDSAS
jgi:hypothetical protein